MFCTRRPALALVLSCCVALVLSSKPTLAAVSFTGDTQIGSPFYVGYTGFGTFRIDGGSTYTSSSSTTVLGFQSSAVGIATVTGAGSQWTLTNSSGIDVGGSGYGRLEVLNGAVVTSSTSCCGGIDIGANSGSQGDVVVDGAGSFVSTGTINVGQSSSAGPSRLQVSNNAMVFASQTNITSQGRIELSNGLLRTGQFSTNNGVIIGTGEVQFSSTSPINNYGRIESAGAPLRFTGGSGALQNYGVIAAENGALEFNRTISNSTTGPNAAEITLRNASMRMGLLAGSGPQLTNSAVLAAIGGTSDFYGRVTNTATGSIAVTNRSVMIFHDDVVAEGGNITVFPGSSAVFLEDLTMNEGSQLHANLAGTNQNTGFGDVEVVGVATLAGNVQATLAAGYTPAAGDSFQIVAASSIAGALSLGDMPALPSGLKWDLDHEASRVILNVAPGLAGDYNSNGAVDSGDYVLWRKTLTQAGPNLAADGNSNGVVDAGDFAFWRSRFADTAGAGLSNTTTIPEPASITLFFLGLALVGCRGQKLH